MNDAAEGDISSAISTLNTAINLIRQSKVSNDDACRALIRTLEVCSAYSTCQFLILICRKRWVVLKASQIVLESIVVDLVREAEVAKDRKFPFMAEYSFVFRSRHKHSSSSHKRSRAY